MKNKLFYSLIIIIAFLSLWSIAQERFLNESDGKKPEKAINLKLGDKTIKAVVAKTESEKSQGLSGKEKITDGDGMFFPFEKEGQYYFWMQNMNFPIDIIWLDKNYTIVDLTRNLKPDSYPNSVTSQKPAQFILEINTGLIDKYQLKKGDKIEKIN